MVPYYLIFKEKLSNWVLQNYTIFLPNSIASKKNFEYILSLFYDYAIHQR